MVSVQRPFRWIYNKILEHTRRFILAALASGPVPRHIAFIMDGNRRYARKNSIKTQQGHADGCDTLILLLAMCFRLNIRYVSVYAFSIENFKRSPEEVDAIMALAEEKLLGVRGKGFRVNVIGRVELLPKRLQDVILETERITRHFDWTLNLCMPYTSQDEITRAIEDCVNDGLTQCIDPDIYFTKEEINRRLMLTARVTPPLDILVRTSGVKRLSDFLLWQCCEDTQIQFSSTHWPDFGLWDLMFIILDYQRKVYSRRTSIEMHK